MNHYLNIKDYYESLGSNCRNSKRSIKIKCKFHKNLDKNVTFSDILSTTTNKTDFISAFSWLGLFSGIIFIPLGSVNRSSFGNSYIGRARVTYQIFGLNIITLKCIHNFKYSVQNKLCFLKETWELCLPRPIEYVNSIVITKIPWLIGKFN